MTSEAPQIIIRPRSRWTPVNPREVWEFRDLLHQLTVRDLKLRYRQTVLGAAWVVLLPLLSATIFSFVFGRVAKLESDGVPYFAFSFVGMVAWTAFSQTLTKVSGSLVSNSQLVSKIYFPRLVLPLSSIGSTLVDVGVASAVGAVVLVVTGVAPGVQLVTAPLWLLVLLALSMGIGLVASALMVQYRDIVHILPVVVQLLLYASPIGYSLTAVPRSARGWLSLNPLTGAVTGFRWAVLDTPAPSLASVIWSGSCAVLVLAGGAMFFAGKERQFADAI